MSDPATPNRSPKNDSLCRDGSRDYSPVTPGVRLEQAVRSLVRLAIDEDLNDAVDWTTVCLIEPNRQGACEIVPREAGVCAGVVMLDWIIDEFDADLRCRYLCEDGMTFVAGAPIARLEGNARDLLTSERTILNVISRLCGIATLTRHYVDQIAGGSARLYDTRKTTPGWRLLEKYAVRCGGANNHRSGLYDGFLVKDNHLALAGDGTAMHAGEAAAKALRWRGSEVERMKAPNIVEVEVDSLQQLREVLKECPNIVLLDNFRPDQLREAVALRDSAASSVELEASGNVKIDTIAQIAATGVDRISSGALTHQATSLDLGLDWLDGAAS